MMRKLFAGLLAGLVLASALPATAQTQIVITSGTTWLVPLDFNISRNTIDTIGSGAPGGSSAGDNFGGGGGAFSRKSNLPLTPGSTVSIQVGGGLDTWVVSTGTVLAKAGTLGTGGSSAAGVGDLKYPGGDGGHAAGDQAAGGGGAAGSHGGGSNGTAAGATADGGGGDSGFGGAGGVGNNAGAAGTQYGSVGSGGGGGANDATGCSSGGAYGGGSAAGMGCGAGVSFGGLIVITYIPNRRTSAGAF